MTLHYLKIAARNLVKFKLQTVVCLMGLAIGMTCFALGTLWLRFIESFENFVPDANNVYLVASNQDESTGNLMYESGYTAGESLMSEHSEIMEWCTLSTQQLYDMVKKDGTSESIDVKWADSAFFRMFGIKALEGSLEHLGEYDAVVTESLAKKLFGDKHAVGKIVELRFLMALRTEDVNKKIPHNIVAVIPDCPKNTQFSYSLLTPIPHEMEDVTKGYANMFYTFARKHAAANVDSLTQKSFIAKDKSIYDDYMGYRLHHMRLLPIRSLRTDHLREASTIQTNYVRWFVMLGVLVIACALFNYLITMITRMRIREREFALRRVNGASRRSIYTMLSVETLLLFLMSSALGWLFTWLVLPAFREYSGINLPLGDIALEVWLYLAGVTAFGLASMVLTAMFVMRRSRTNILYTRHSHRTSTTLDRSGIIVQLALAMSIIFSASVIMLQIHYICYSGDMGFDVNDVSLIRYTNEAGKQQLKHSPLVGDMVETPVFVFPCSNLDESGFYADSLTANNTRDFEEIEVHPDRLIAYDLPIDSNMVRMLGYQLIEGRLPLPGNMKPNKLLMEQIARGEMTNEVEIREVCVTENIVRKLGLKDPVGKKLYSDFGWCSYLITGVIKDLYFTGATKEPDMYIMKNTADFHYEPEIGGEPVRSYYIRPAAGKSEELRDSLKSWRKYSYDTHSIPLFSEDIGEKFQEYIASERLLLNVLWIVALASIFVCVVGAFSLISLSLEERRKEIAIRKVHGAKMLDIMKLFLRGQVISLAVAAVVAYPISFIIMRHWLEGYTKQVAIGWWLIPATLLAIAAVVLATISLKIWKAAKESTVAALAA